MQPRCMVPLIERVCRVRCALRSVGCGLWRCRYRVAVAVLLATALSAAVLLWPMDVAPYLEVRPSPELLDRHGRTLHVFLNDDEQWCLERDLDEISPWLIRATIAAEDQRFHSHPGVDPLAVVRAALQNLRSGRVVSGASTLEMQVVKLAGLRSSSVRGKLAQALGALRLARHVPKDDVLRAYLNRAPYGMNLVGCEAAARRYFGKSSAELTIAEAALLAGLPREPTRLMPLRHPERALARRRAVLQRMFEDGMIDERQLAAADAEPLGTAWHEFPAEAPHLAMRLRGRMQTGALTTTLEAPIQELVNEALRRHVAAEATIGNGAVIVIEAATGHVLAHVGSPDFFDENRAGQFDATAAVRSPGSTLKPLLYALAIENDRLYPYEALLDDTMDLGDFRPVNFDGRYRGLVPASDALRESLNIPALVVLGRVGAAEALRFLRECGLATLTRSAGDYGAGLALGNCEARLDQLVAAYRMLVNLGNWRPLVWLPGDEQPERRLLSPGTAAAVLEMLRRPLPGEIEKDRLGATGLMLPVAWKTGTSTGNRDAWCIMFNADYVVGVWLGNHDARPSPRLVGAEVALPLAAEIFRALPGSGSGGWPEVAPLLRDVEVCAVSGLPVGRWCPHTRVSRLPREQYLLRRCDVHWPARDGGVIERWPGMAAGWDLAEVKAPIAVTRSSSVEVEAAPAGLSSLRELSIVEPASGATFVLSGVRNGDRIAPRASRGDMPLHWFLDDTYIGRSDAGQRVEIALTAGEHRLVCVAADGQIAQTRFEVVTPDSSLRFRE